MRQYLDVRSDIMYVLVHQVHVCDSSTSPLLYMCVILVHHLYIGANCSGVIKYTVSRVPDMDVPLSRYLKGN